MNYYSFDITLLGSPVFSGYFIVDTTQIVFPGYNLITAFYDYSQPTGPNTWVDIYLNDGLNAEDSGFNTTFLHLSNGGTNINTTNNTYFQTLSSNDEANLYWAGNLDVIDTWSNPYPTNYTTYTNYTFVISLIQPPICFNKGSKILCLNDIYVPIEDLKPGDFVKTYKDGYKPIDLIGKNIMVNNPNKPFECMYNFKDLIVTGGHGILKKEPNVLDPDKLWVNSKFSKIDNMFLHRAAFCNEFKMLTDTNIYTYYHLTLKDKNDNMRFGIWANGILTETVSKNQFKTNLKLV